MVSRDDAVDDTDSAHDIVMRQSIFIPIVDLMAVVPPPPDIFPSLDLEEFASVKSFDL